MLSFASFPCPSGTHNDSNKQILVLFIKLDVALVKTVFGMMEDETEGKKGGKQRVYFNSLNLFLTFENMSYIIEGQYRNDSNS